MVKKVKNTKTKQINQSSQQVEQSARAGFVRRLAAMIYDALVATAVGMCAAMVLIVVLVVSLKNGWLDLQGYSEPNELLGESVMYKTLIQIWVGLWVAGFFLWFWKRGGQTLGMRAWRLRIYSTTDEPVGWGRLVLRLIASLGGLGTLLVLLDVKNKQSLQDRLAQTEVLKLTKEQNNHKSW